MVKSRYPLIDANMKELLATGFMSNRGRQVVFGILSEGITLQTIFSHHPVIYRFHHLYVDCLLIFGPGHGYRLANGS
jgi:hypothetical protein